MIVMEQRSLTSLNGLHFTARYSKSGEQYVQMTLVVVNIKCQASPQDLPEASVLSVRNSECPASSAASSVLLSSQVSVMIAAQLSILRETILSRISSSLLISHRTLARKRLGRAGLCGLACSFARSPLRLPRFCLQCFLSPRQKNGGGGSFSRTLHLRWNKIQFRGCKVSRVFPQFN